VAQTPLERGRYLVDTVMTCHNCHTPRGPNGFEFDKALSGGLRFDEPPFDVWASNITPDRDTGIGNWSDAEIKTALQEGTRPAGPRAPQLHARRLSQDPAPARSRRHLSLSPLAPAGGAQGVRPGLQDANSASGVSRRRAAHVRI